jgi:hypothetical protein
MLGILISGALGALFILGWTYLIAWGLQHAESGSWEEKVFIILLDKKITGLMYLMTTVLILYNLSCTTHYSWDFVGSMQNQTICSGLVIL